MLDIKILVTLKDQVVESLEKRNNQAAKDLIPIVESLDVKRRELIQKVEALKAKRNQASQDIARAKKGGGN
jgi:seryl-tRNA synthetase